uniref:Uncharacterized protein n=1 Tax=Tetranychus urticae TaxID=32264 RepID=T1KLB5_TETUR
MPRYKRAEFTQDDAVNPNYSDTIGFDNMYTSSSQLTMSPENSGPPLDPATLSYCFTFNPHTLLTRRSRRRNFWDRASPLERLLIISLLVTALIALILFIIVVNSFGHSKISTSSKDDLCLSKSCLSIASTIVNSMDVSKDPCQDFYAYSCGGWVESNPLPDGKSIWGPFAKLWQDNQYVMKTVLEQDSTNQSKAEEESRVYYRSCLDKNETIEKLGAMPMQQFLTEIGGWNMSSDFNASSWDFQMSLQVVHNRYNRGGFFSWAVGADAKNSSNNIIQLDQGGLSLPSRDYYLNKSSDDEVLQAFKSFTVKVAVLLGGKQRDVEKQVDDLIEFETRLAEITVPSENRTDDDKIYQRITLQELQKAAPAINWITYFKEAFDQIEYNITENELVGVYSIEYLQRLSDLVVEYNKTDEKRIVLANYMGWSVVQSLISCLSKPFREASKILRKALIGSEGIESSWRYCVTDTNGFMGFALGAMFVKSVFRGESKPTAEAMIEQIRKAFEDNLPNLRWMDTETRKLAKEKADAITKMIGFPDFILNSTKLNEKYEGLTFEENEYFQNNIRVNKFALKKNIEKITRPANKTEWEMTPSTVNAYYTPTKDTMVFPAGILQAPFYDVNYPKSVNFGAMGVVMGHELTHAFDDRGRRYDKYGNLHQWWNNNTIKNFEQRVDCFVKQYSSYEINGDYINGERTLGENLADNGGLKAAFHAYENWAQHNIEPALPGVNLTSKQIFFVRFAQVWCFVATPEALKLQVLNDPHSPHRFRVIGTLSNSKEFSDTFKCPLNSPMNPEHKCEVW